MRMLFFLGTLTTLWSCSGKKLILDVPKIMNRTPQEVIGVLGEPDSAFTQFIVTKVIFTQIYNRQFNVEIMYPEGLATDIVVYDPAPDLPFEPETLEHFGLSADIAPSDTMKETYIKWKNYPGFKTINLFVTKLDSIGQVSQYLIFFKSDGKRRG